MDWNKLSLLLATVLYCSVHFYFQMAPFYPVFPFPVWKINWFNTDIAEIGHYCQPWIFHTNPWSVWRNATVGGVEPYGNISHVILCTDALLFASHTRTTAQGSNKYICLICHINILWFKFIFFWGYNLSKLPSILSAKRANISTPRVFIFFYLFFFSKCAPTTFFCPSTKKG